ncbi:LexA family transcriptional regulator [Streptococcus sp. DD12]|uniref:LexA family transcriptional regulator n=1 Tax=Streptococcus sp. DD12 TaxID=1777880 RepID=UPI0007911525|nr:XRE family transcriptional regulator [Streptococcus sp. DD12]KXT76638.1 Pleiotropic regulator [Streptococcus sp. DD12]
MFSGERLKARRLELGLTQVQVAQALGVAQPSYHNWEIAKTQPNKKNKQMLATLFEVSLDYFEGQYELTSIYDQLNPKAQGRVLSYARSLLDLKAAESEESTKVIKPLFAYKVYERLSAGTGYSYFDDGSYDEVFYHEKFDHDFASWVFGDSMEPTYLNGEVVLIKQTGFDYDGAVYAVDWDGQTYIKKVYREADGLRLVSINKKYQDKFAPYEEEPRIVGKIVGNFMPQGS